MSMERAVIECGKCGEEVSSDRFGHLYCANKDCTNTNFVNSGILDLTQAGFEITWRSTE